MRFPVLLPVAMVTVCLSLAAFVGSAQSRGGAITGQILKPDGSPAVGLRVAAMAADATPESSSLHGITQTDAEGRYRVEEVPPGRYYVEAGAVQAPTYFPGVVDRAKASVVTVQNENSVVAGRDFTAEPPRSTPTAPGLPLAGGRVRSCPPDTTPSQPVAGDDFVQIEHTACHGVCEQYSVRITGNGDVSILPVKAETWTGRLPDVRVQGTETVKVSAEKARALIENYRTEGIYGLCARYAAGLEGPDVISTVSIAGKEKSVANARDLVDLVKEAEMLADVHRWLHGDPRTESLSGLRRDVTGTKPGVTPLMQASGNCCEGGGRTNLAHLDALLASKADPNAQDASGWTPLIYASIPSDSAAVVERLIAAGANPNLRSYSGQTPLMAQVAFTYLNDNSVQSIRQLLAAGADINATDNNGQTALMLTIRGSLSLNPSRPERADLAVFLRENGARTNIRDASGRTALDLLNEEAQRESKLSDALFEKMRKVLQ